MDYVLLDLFPRLVNSGVFGDCKEATLSFDDSTSLGAQFTSEIVFATVKKVLESGETSSLPIIIKTQVKNKTEIELRDIYTQFSNEVNMYKEILPFLDKNKCSCYPKFYYGCASRGLGTDKDILILENMTDLGFSLSKGDVFLNFEHISLAMKRLGEFHSWSYLSKTNHHLEFIEKAKKLKNCETKPTDDFNLNELVFNSISAGVEPLLEKNIQINTLKDFLDTFKSLPSIFELLMKPTDPFSVIVHGDFCRNNIFFKYDNNGHPIDCAFFDFQTSKYSSPAIDLAFFLYMHTTNEIREKYWDRFLEMYYTSFRSNLPNCSNFPNFELFLDHFAARAVYGYIHSSFFLPMMMLERALTIPEVMMLSNEEKVNYFRNSAGEKGSKAISGVVSHMLEKGYIHKFLDYYKSNATNLAH